MEYGQDGSKKKISVMKPRKPIPPIKNGYITIFPWEE